MELKEAVEKLRVLLKFSEEPPAPMSEIALKDGTKLVIEGAEPVSGASAMIISSDGAKVSAPDGEYEAEDGTMIMVAGGKVLEIKAPSQAPESALDATKMSTMFSELETRFEEKIKALEKKVVDLEKASGATSEAMKRQEKISEDTFSIVEKIAQLPATAPLEVVPKIVANEDKFASIINGITELKKHKK